MPSLIIIIAMFGLLYFVLLRPQRAKQQRQKQLLTNVEPGDEILTVGGVYGIVEEVEDEDDLIVQIAAGVNVRVARRAVATVVKPDADDEEDAEEGAEVEETGEILDSEATQMHDETGSSVDSPAKGEVIIKANEDSVRDVDAPEPASAEHR